MSLSVSSPAFNHGQSIPSRHTCDGDNLSPPLSWQRVPQDTQSLALIVDDPDAPDPSAPKRTWVHWVVWNIPPSAGDLAEGISRRALPGDAREGSNDSKRVGYDGPCPPVGRHRYFHKIYALDVLLPDLSNPTKAGLEAAMEGHVLESAELIGTYERTR